MTPTTLTRPTTFKSALPHSPTELAAEPLRFTTQGQCKGKQALAAVTEALADKIRPDHCIAAIFKNAWLHQYQHELNQIITSIETRHGTGMVLVNENVLRILSEEGINLLQNSDGTVQLEKIIAVESDPTRHAVISSSLENIFPTELSKLIASFDDEIEICEKSRAEIIAILESDDPTAKSLLIAAASHQRQIQFLNKIFQAQLIKEKPLNLFRVDLSNLDLTGIDLTHANLSFANLQNCCLRKARLVNVWLMYANLNNADLSNSILIATRLDNARLIGANLVRAHLNEVNLDYACLLCANLNGAQFGNPYTLTSAIFNFSTFENFQSLVCGYDQLFPRAQEPLKAKILPRLPDPYGTLTDDSIPESFSGPIDLSKRPITVVIDENEKLILLKQGVVITENRDGTAQLSLGLSMRADPGRKLAIYSALTTTLPKVLTGLINAYDEEMEISEKNESAIIRILKSGDQAAKGLIIAAASQQSQIAYLNILFPKLRQQGVKLDFSRVDLSNLNLTGINLDYVNLGHAVMHGCNLYQATLRNANLSCVNLNGARLEQTEFTNANMSGARLFQANLKQAVLISVNLMDAVLKFADLDSADLQGGTDLTSAYLDHANLTNANLAQAVMVNVSLTHATMSGVDLYEANLTNAKLTHANLRWASLVAVNITNADLSHANLERVTLVGEPVLKGSVWKDVRARIIFSDAPTRKMLPFLIRIRCH